MDSFKALSLAFLLVSLTACEVGATTYSVENQAPTTPGGQRYEAEMGDAWTLQMLATVREKIVEVLSRSYRPVDHVKFVVEDSNGAASNSGDVIRVGAKFLAGIAGDVRFEIQGLVYHEMCHSFQNNKGQYGTDKHFTGVIEGIATYIELVAGYGIGPKVKGGEWFKGYETTAHFFAWIDQTQRTDFVNLLNEKMGLLDWDDVFFVNITGTDVDTLWQMYQASF